MSHLRAVAIGPAATALPASPAWLRLIPKSRSWHTERRAGLLIAARELPMVDAQILFRAGSVRDGERPGLAQLTNGLLEERYDWFVDTIADRLDQVGA